MTYRPAIDGLRAIAVLSVMLFHLDERMLAGGFVGVDIFFVISGYLITSIVLSDFDKDRFSFARFYQRRISRIYPVFFLVSIVVLAATAVVYMAHDFSSAGSTLVAAAVSMTNMKFIFQGNYFKMSSDAQPFLHYWSLAVEEQYYLVFPLTLFVAARHKVSRKSLSIFLAIAALLSFIGCILLTPKNQTWAFYLLPTRAWELLAGCILAIWPFSTVRENGSAKSHNKIDTWLAGAGLVLIIASVFLIHENMGFPGWIAAFPVLGTVLVIGRPLQSRGGVTERLLSHPAGVLIGKASYSLYLWHWPVYSIVDYGLFAEPPLLRTVLKIMLTLALSFASYHWFENPVRVSLNRPEMRRFGYILFSAGAVVMLVTGYWVRNSYYINARPGSARDGGIAFNEGKGYPRVVLLGDSNGSMYGLIMKEIARERHVNVHVLSTSAHNPMPGTQLYKESLAFVRENNPDVTILVALWTAHLDTNRELLARAVSDILQYSHDLILITQPPRLPDDFSRESIRKSGLKPVFEKPYFTRKRHISNALVASFQSDRVHVLNIESLFRKPDGEILFLDEEGRQLFEDDVHISEYGARRVMALLEAEIDRLLAERYERQGGSRVTNSSLHKPLQSVAE